MFTNAMLPTTAEAANRRVGTSTSASRRATAASGTGFEDLTLGIVPKTTIPAGATAPTLDGAEGAGEYSGEAPQIGRKWEPAGSGRNCEPSAPTGGSIRAGIANRPTPRSPESVMTCPSSSTSGRLPDLRGQARGVRRALARRLGRVIIDPRGNASQVLKDTANTFKLGIFLFTNDPGYTNGNGANGRCWSRDARSTIRASPPDCSRPPSPTPERARVIVKSTAPWVGRGQTTWPRAYGGGRYNLEVKHPWRSCRRRSTQRHRPQHHALLQGRHLRRPGSPTLRHIDHQQAPRVVDVRLGQSDPYKWGHATPPG